MKISELAEKIGAVVDGDGSAELCGVAAIDEARAGELSFVANPKYASKAESTSASAVIVSKDWDSPSSATLLKVDNPDAAFSQATMFFAPELPAPPAGVHPSAVIGEGVELGEGISVGPCAVIADGVKVGARTVISAGCYVGYRAEIGDDVFFHPNVNLREYVRIGNRVIVHNGTVIGSDGFGYSVDRNGVRTKIPQIGTVEIGDDVEIGANVTIDRARFGKTAIGKGVKIDNLVQIAHNVVIEDHAVVVAQVGISGSSRIGSRAILAGQVGVAGHLTVAPGAVVGAQSGVSKSITAPGFYLGSPAAPGEKAAKAYAMINRLPHLKKQLAELAERVRKLES